MTHLNKQLRAVSICKYIFSEELLISGIILQACKCCHSSPSLFCIGISHSHCKRLEMLNTATFLSVNMNMYSFFLHLPSLPPPLCALPLTPLCLSNFPISAISLSSSSPLLSRALICQGLYLYLPTHTVQNKQVWYQALSQYTHLQLICFWMRETKPLNVLVKVEACLSLSTCKF